MKREIINYIEKELIAQPELNLSADEDILTTGLIDSLGIMKLIAHLEETYQVSIPAEDMTIEYFLTVEAISAYVTSLQSVEA